MTRLLNLNDDEMYSSYLQEAVYALKDGKIIAFPTETVYGLGVNGLDADAVANLNKIKERPEGKEFTFLIRDKACLKKYVNDVPEDGKKLIEKFWPGPLTLVMPSKYGGEIGLRIPKHKVTNDLLSMVNLPIAAPSANISGEPPLVDAKAIFNAFNGKIELVLNYGTSTMGKPSTVVRINEQKTEILRQGAISQEEIYDCIICREADQYG